MWDLPRKLAFNPKAEKQIQCNKNHLVVRHFLKKNLGFSILDQRPAWSSRDLVRESSTPVRCADFPWISSVGFSVLASEAGGSVVVPEHVAWLSLPPTSDYLGDTAASPVRTAAVAVLSQSQMASKVWLQSKSNHAGSSPNHESTSLHPSPRPSPMSSMMENVCSFCTFTISACSIKQRHEWQGTIVGDMIYNVLSRCGPSLQWLSGVKVKSLD